MGHYLYIYKIFLFLFVLVDIIVIILSDFFFQWTFGKQLKRFNIWFILVI